VQNESPCEFIRHLQGSKKGDKVECIDQLKKFLHYFGYLNHGGLNNDEVGGDYFDETIERALKTYQINFNLKPTGVLDAETVSLMMKPRCGVPDIVDGKTRMKSAGSYNIDCAFFPGSPKGQKLRKYLTGDIDLVTEEMCLILLQNVVLNHGVIIYLLYLIFLRVILVLQTSRLASLKMAKEVWIKVNKLLQLRQQMGECFSMPI